MGWFSWLLHWLGRGKREKGAVKRLPIVEAPRYHRWYDTRREQEVPIPVGRPLRVWVVLLDGRELELHASFDPIHGWDLPLGLRLEINYIKAWQLIDPPDSERQIEYCPTVVGEITPPTMQVRLEVRPREFPRQKRLLLTYRLTEGFRARYFIETGEVIGAEQVVVWEPDFRQLTRELREAFLWLTIEYGHEPVYLGEFGYLLQVEDLNEALAGLCRDIQTQRSQDLHLAYRFLSEMQIRSEIDCYRYLQQLRQFERFIRAYGDDQIQLLYRTRQGELRLCWERARDEWIERWGSPGLRYLRQQGPSSAVDRLYLQERSQWEFPGFVLLSSDDQWIAKEGLTPQEWQAVADYPGATVVLRQGEGQVETGLLIADFLGTCHLYRPLASLPSGTSPELSLPKATIQA